MNYKQLWDERGQQKRQDVFLASLEVFYFGISGFSLVLWGPVDLVSDWIPYERDCSYVEASLESKPPTQTNI